MAALGVNPGDRIAVLGENRPEWLYCHLGCMSLGGATSGIYPTSAADQIAYEVDHSESKILFVENEETGGQSSANNRQSETQQGRRMGTKRAVGIYS